MNVITCKRENVTRGDGCPHAAGFRLVTFSRYRAFTLIEMLVSLAVLALALGVVGVVFAVTTRTASQSAAYSETHNLVRQWMQQIQEDLAHCDPANSILVLAGRTQAAALTQGDLEAGKFYRVLVGNPRLVAAGYDPEFDPNLDPQYSNPRADILMFFSSRPTASQAPPLNAGPNDPYAAGVRFSPILVVYGHAALGMPAWTGSTYQLPPDNALRHIAQAVDGSTNPRRISKIPATRWHLARRATIIDNRVETGKCWLTDQELARVRPCVASQDYAGDVAQLDWAELLARFHYFSGVFPAQYRPYGEFMSSGTDLVSYVNSFLYGSGGPDNLYHVATILEEVPLELKSNLGVHMLPGCVWFQVEFLMPEDPRNSVVYSSPDPENTGLSRRADMPRWTQVEEGQTYVFVPDTAENRSAVAQQVDPATGLPYSGSRLASFARLDQDPTGDSSHPETVISSRIIRMWPYAIRVTVRVYDRRARLDEPIIRSIVHRFE